ncbi:hypothetical protein GZH47_25385 [Paenibacillus rhizovicinus]|uniref:HNH nuclease domain-containing protein n=1 Tax=Paenibacillus rhizovicinus TaxID=2704463 RepID=A0A6C0PB54_9BACL|nr:HNH endonuclease [Paenibacillus rhizovicinus]QHW33802.1 hypothetical protein GZH47_25385 [Paenibacillus rhizovicinus]
MVKIIYSIGSKKGKIVLKCEDCGEIRETQRNTAILEKEEHPCRACSNKRNGKNKIGKPSWNSGHRKPQDERQLGSIYQNHHGYYEIYLAGDSVKYGRKDGYVLMHRKVVQDNIERPLGEKELIHHIDGNKLNNDLSNLFLCSSMSHHRDIHNSLEEVAFQLYHLGLITFDHENQSYKLAPSVSNDRVDACEFRKRLRPIKGYDNPEPSLN